MANSFAKGFQEAFVPGLKIGASAAEKAEEARLSASEAAKTRQQEIKSAQLMLDSGSPDIVPLAQAVVDGEISFKQMGETYNMMSKGKASSSGGIFIGPGGKLISRVPTQQGEIVPLDETQQSIDEKPQPDAVEQPGALDRPPDIKVAEGVSIKDVKVGPTGALKGGTVVDSAEQVQRDLDKKALEGKVSTQTQTETQESKLAAQKERDFNRTRNKANQIIDLIDRAYDKSDEMLAGVNNILGRFGIQIDRGPGFLGRVYGAVIKAQAKFGYNEFVESGEGLLTEVATAVMRMSIPARSAQLVKEFKATLPPLSGNPREDVSQIAETMTNGFADSIATAVDPDTGDPAFTSDQQDNMIEEYKKNAYATFSKALGINYDGDLANRASSIETQKEHKKKTSEEMDKVKNFKF